MRNNAVRGNCKIEKYLLCLKTVVPHLWMDDDQASYMGKDASGWVQRKSVEILLLLLQFSQLNKKQRPLGGCGDWCRVKGVMC